MRTATSRRLIILLLVTCFGLCSAPDARADSPPLGPIPTEASGPSIDPAAATRAYLATIPAADKASSDAYFEGGYWLILWNTILGAGIMLLILATGWSAAWFEWAARLVRWREARVAIYAAVFALVTTLLSFPLTVYQGFFREHQYHMATQTFGPWLGEQVIATIVQMVVSAIFLPVLYAVFRRTGRAWWVWGSAVAVVFFSLFTVIGPLFIAPLFNQYKPLQDAAIRDQILALARANQIPADHVNEFDASRQTTRVSANVDGGFGIARINLNDNLIKRCSLPEIRQVMAHEMGTTFSTTSIKPSWSSPSPSYSLPRWQRASSTMRSGVGERRGAWMISRIRRVFRCSS